MTGPAIDSLGGMSSSVIPTLPKVVYGSAVSVRLYNHVCWSRTGLNSRRDSRLISLTTIFGSISFLPVPCHPGRVVMRSST